MPVNNPFLNFGDCTFIVNREAELPWERFVITHPCGMSVKIVLDSINQTTGYRLVTIQARYPRFIHAEVMTHRQFSRNARSSRAVPVSKLAAEDIYVPTFGVNQSGMQSREVAEERLQRSWRNDWLRLAGTTQATVLDWGKNQMHKQWANRPLEWFGFIDVLISSTHWMNFLQLRDHEDAQPEIQLLAAMIRELLLASKPGDISSWSDSWHLPYITPEEYNSRRDPHAIDLELPRVSVARCARVSYKPFDGTTPDIEADLKLYDKLYHADPMHASAFEHAAKPDMHVNISINGVNVPLWINGEQHGNFTGWRQYRKMLGNEAMWDKPNLNVDGTVIIF